MLHNELLQTNDLGGKNKKETLRGIYTALHQIFFETADAKDEI